MVRKIILVLLLFTGLKLPAQNGYYFVVEKIQDSVRIYTPTLFFTHDTILPTIHLYSTKTNKKDVTLIINFSDTINDIRDKIKPDNSNGSLHSSFTQVKKNHWQLVVCFTMQRFKYSPKTNIRLYYLTPDGKYKNHITYIPFLITNEE